MPKRKMPHGAWTNIFVMERVTLKKMSGPISREACPIKNQLGVDWADASTEDVLALYIESNARSPIEPMMSMSQLNAISSARDLQNPVWPLR